MAAIAALSRHLPVVFFLAIGFYATALVALVFPPFRRALGSRLHMATPSNQPHLAPLDAFRGLAAMGIAVFHTLCWYNGFFRIGPMPDFLTRGDKAVGVFVALSGFLIYRSARTIETSADLRHYLWNRFLRIYPLYAASVIILALADRIGSAPGEAWQYFLNNILMLRTLGGTLYANPPVWSLYVEVLFYLILPAFIAVAGWGGGGYAGFCRRRSLVSWRSPLPIISAPAN